MSRVLVLGATGMLGHTMFRWFQQAGAHEVWGTVRDPRSAVGFSADERARLITGVNVVDEAALTGVLDRVRPDVCINCVGVVKQLAAAHDPLVVLPINAMLPHRLAREGAVRGMRVLHVSTDCVFAGTRGGYREDDPCDTQELYGQSKFLGEVRDAAHVFTARVSIIGHELASHRSLVDWFLAQSGPVRGYTRAIFSGLPTVELARVFHDIVLPRPDLGGLYHVAAEPISKHALLGLVAEVYGVDTEIVPSEDVVIDRSLNADRFTSTTGYRAPAWPDLVRTMYQWRAL